METSDRQATVDRVHSTTRPPTVLLLAATILLLLGWTSGCGPGKPAGPYNIILISIDTLRADHLGCYGYSRDTSPHLDALAKKGWLFENTIAASCWTLPSHATMLTGRYPSFHGVQDEGVKLSQEVPTLADHLQQKGYRTFAVVSHIYVSKRFGMEKGFEVFDDTLLKGAKVEPVAAKVIDRALELFERNDDRPYFAFIHFYDPHWDYTPPPPFDTRFTDPGYSGPIDGSLKSMSHWVAGPEQMSGPDLQQTVALYDGEIAYVDQQIDRLLDRLEEAGHLEDTVLMITSDHGEEFQEHRNLGHQKSLFTEITRVPLIVTGEHPALGKGRRHDDLVSLIDLAPTILEIAGAEPLPGALGQSLLSGDRSENRKVLAETVRYGYEMRSVQDPDFKLIHYREGDRKHFYDLEKDPRELKTLMTDPSGGELSEALSNFAMMADAGWHLKIVNMRPEPLTCRARIETEGLFVRPQRYFTRLVGDPRRIKFEQWQLAADQKSIEFEVTLTDMMGEIAFKTEPADAAVTFKVAALNENNSGGVFLGAGQAIQSEETVQLLPDDPRLTGMLQDYKTLTPGCYIRTVVPQVQPGEDSDLTPADVERLRALGY